MSSERLDEIDRRYGAGGGYTGAPTKHELRLALIELVDEVRRQRRAERNAMPATLPVDHEAREAENRRLWERAAQSDYQHAMADLRAAKLRLVLISALRSFTEKKHLGRKVFRSGWVEAVTIEQWQRVFDETGATVGSTAGLRQQWGVRWPDEEITTCANEDDARGRASSEAGATPLCRYVTGWENAGV